MTDTDTPSEAPQMPQDAANPEEGAPVATRDLLDSLAHLAAHLAQTKGITAAERLMVLDGWIVDAIGTLGYLLTRQQAQIMDLTRALTAAFQSAEAAAEVPQVQVEAEAADLAAKFAASRLQAEIDYLTEKPGGPGLTVVTRG